MRTNEMFLYVCLWRCEIVKHINNSYFHHASTRTNWNQKENANSVVTLECCFYFGTEFKSIRCFHFKQFAFNTFMCYDVILMKCTGSWNDRRLFQLQMSVLPTYSLDNFAIINIAQVTHIWWQCLMTFGMIEQNFIRMNKVTNW